MCELMLRLFARKESWGLKDIEGSDDRGPFKLDVAQCPRNEKVGAAAMKLEADLQ